VANFERRDVWDMKWDTEKEDMEKSRMIVIQVVETEEPVPNNGYWCKLLFFRYFKFSLAVVSKI